MTYMRLLFMCWYQIVTVEAVREELYLSSSMDDIFIPVYANDPNLARIYIGTESGILRVYPGFFRN